MLPPKAASFRDGGLLWGATNSGKSYAVGHHALIRYATTKGKHLITCAKTNLVQRQIVPMLRDLAYQYGVPFEFVSTRNEIQIGASLVYIVANAKVGDEMGLYSYHNVQSLWAEEISRQMELGHNFAVGRCDPFVPIWATCNPVGPTNWVKYRLDKGMWDHEAKFTIEDNPSLGPERVEEIKRLARQSTDTLYYDRMIEGKWISPEGLVYPRWRECTCTFDQHAPYLLAYDPAPVNTQAAIAIQTKGGPGTGMDAHFCAVDEIYTRRGATLRNARAALEQIQARWGRPLLAVLDTAAYDHVHEATFYMRWNVTTPHTKEHVVTIPRLNLLLEQERLRVNPATCPNTAAELYSVIYDETKEKIANNQEDHATDALRYIAPRLEAEILPAPAVRAPTFSEQWDEAYAARTA